MIIGGGPAGMEAARWLKRRGHQPVLYEKSGRLGGQLLLASLPPHKEEMDTFRQFLVRQMSKMGVQVNLSTEVTPEIILQEKPDIVLIATGGRPIKPNFIIDKAMKSLDALQVLSGKEVITGQKIVILGGGFIAAEVAEFIAEKGKEVTVMEMRDLVAFDMEPNSRQMLIERLEKLGVKMVTQIMVQEVTARGVKGKVLKSGGIQEFPADCVVAALGSEPAEFSVEELQKAGVQIRFIGDAKEVHGIAEAVRDGFVAGIAV